ncbi:hypothetical protein [Roseovarius sp. M141]|uniref:hypothetical protein n=1 Tax=Roseovarius sp. M141 TaxID=2583806 RepID=UPI0020CEBC99|nr:hypothetical protein [Roseovarius sp. M141]
MPVLYRLSVPTFANENFMQKTGAQSMAAKLGVAIVALDTSPRSIFPVLDFSAIDGRHGKVFSQFSTVWC